MHGGTVKDDRRILGNVMPKTAIIFPGQGAQAVGMGADFAEAHRASRDVFEQASDILGWDVLDVCTNGPQERLSATDVQQPAILATSAAIVAAIGPLDEIQPLFGAAAGLSLGEYGALYFAGSLSLSDALRLVRERGRFMQEAADAAPSSMVSLVGADESAAESICEDAAAGDILVVANLNCPGQVVISGGKDACERAVKAADARGLRAIPLAVAGAFHSPLMQPAADQLEAVLADLTVNTPKVSVVSNVTADYHGDGASIKSLLGEQVTRPVRWQASIERLIADGIECFVEVGPGRVLTGLMRKIDRNVQAVNMSAADKLDQLNLKALA